MTPADFEEASAYDAQLQQGLSLSGEQKDYFASGRMALLSRLTSSRPAPRSVLDFGCGIGDTTILLEERFPGARVVGTDPADGALTHARVRYSDRQIEFVRPEMIDETERFDLVYVNGVFHHIHPNERDEIVRWITRRLNVGGWVALFENNPWNPGARWVMRRIPFDRDAEMLSARVAAGLLRRNGLEILLTRSLFYFPRWLSWFRSVEQRLEKIPLGAQYLVLAGSGEGRT